MPDNYQAWSAWVSLHNHERVLIGGMSIHPMKLSLITTAQYCQLFDLDREVLNKIIIIEDIMYKKIINDYKPKKQSFKPTQSNNSLEIGRNK